MQNRAGGGDHSRQEHGGRSLSRIRPGPSEIETWVDEAKRSMENALRAKPMDIREQYEKQLKELQETYGEAMLDLRARKQAVAQFQRS